MAAGGARLNLNSWVHPRVDVEKWLATAKPGQRFVYARGPELVRGETSRFVGELARAGKVDLFQPRSEAGFDFIIQMRVSPIEPRRREPEDDGALDIIFRALKRAANFGYRAPTNTELAKLAGLATSAQAAWRITKLIERRLIRTSHVTVGPEAGWRVVTIIETGKQTKVPPSWERARTEGAAIPETPREFRRQAG